jgi:hypothetical protein
LRLSVTLTAVRVTTVGAVPTAAAQDECLDGDRRPW